MKSLPCFKETTSRLLALLAVCAGLGAFSAQAQEASRTVEWTYQFDDKGNATIEISFQLSASRWAQWKDQFGDHPDILLRNLKYELAAAVIDDFSLEKDDLHRRAVAKIKARALAQYQGGNQFQIKVNKNLNLVTGSGTEWVFTSSGIEEGGIVNVTERGKLPPKARNAHFVPGDDYNYLDYSLNVAPARSKTLLYLGGLFLLAGAILGATATLISSKGPTPAAA